MTVWLVVASGSAHAARPLVTDDAGITSPRSCQVQSWAESGRGADKLWIAPACTVADRFELTLASGFAPVDGDADHVPLAAQLKTPLARDLGGRVDVAISAAVRHDVVPGVGGEFGAVALNLPATARAFEGELRVHVNAGLGWDGRRDRLLATYGTALELAPWHGLAPMVEVYGDQRTRPTAQLGLRWWLVADRVALDGSFGAPLGRAHERIATFGIELFTTPLW